jgi:glutamate-1-semialdehyde 2,1-aminomutase
MPDYRARLSTLIERERAAYLASHPRSAAAFQGSAQNLLGGVPMTWMRMWPGGFPLYLATASGARLTDIDGNSYVDFCLGDTGAMADRVKASPFDFIRL